MNREQYNFSDDFQDAILASVIRFPHEFWTFGRIIQPAYFNGAVPAEIAIHLTEYVEKYNKYPNFTTLGNYVFNKTERANPDRAKELAEYVVKLASVDTSDYAAVRDMVAKFAKERSLLNALKQIYMAQQEGKSDTIDPVRLVEDALAIGRNTDSDGISLFEHMWQTIEKVSNVTYGVPTGYPLLDGIWKTGLGPGWLFVPLAPPKGKKTMFAINLAYNMISTKIGADVLYYACEISEELAMMRALFRLSSQTPNQLLEEGARKFFKKCQQEYVSNVNGKLWFKGFASKTVSIGDIKTHAKHVISAHGLKPRAIVLDYAETIRPSKTNKNIPDWRQQSDIYTEARAMGHELGCTIIMPDRCNRETVNKAVPSMTSFQGSFEKGGIVDIALGLCGTPEESNRGVMRFFLFLNRHGEQYRHFQGTVNPEIMKIDITEDITDKTNLDEAMTADIGKPKRARPEFDNSELTQN